MKNLHPKSGVLALFLSTALAIGCSEAQTSSMSQKLPPAAMRGYGTVTAATRTLGQGSVTSLVCENVARAQLLQAKYLSDLGSLPGVTTAKIDATSIREINGQGAIAAVRDGKTVLIFAAPSRARLAEILLAELRGKTGLVSEAEVAVPMWLDRWDKFSFRFYYRPWEVPAGETLATYDFTKEFDYAREQDRAGFMFWNGNLMTDTAEGMMSYGWWDWAQQEAKKRDLPVGINSMANEPPTWLLNRYRDQTQLKMPGFTGNYHLLMSPQLGGQGFMSWNGTEIQDADLGVIQNSIRRLAAEPNVTSFLEPHGELYHGRQDVFLEYGPVADAGYRRYLQQKYGTVGALAKRWGRDFKSWDEVRVPELASFTGWGPQALDLGGDWRVGYQELTGTDFNPLTYHPFIETPSKPAPDAWFAPEFDDSAWPQIVAPGHDIQLYTPKRPAVFRRQFEVPADWKAKNPRVWLYLWDLNQATGEQVRVFVNGKAVGRSTIQHYTPHWGALEVTDALQAGTNLLALNLPKGYISYRVYLSPTPPQQYPGLGEQLNAQWVDFAGWMQWSRIQTAQRGMEMIRQVDPNRQISLMAPDAYASGIKELARDYGGNFHNTGWMDVFWGDFLTSTMRGAGLPFSLEPGSPAEDLPQFKKKLGLWQTQGIQGIDYFIHVGDILWKPEIKAHFEANRAQLSLLGQSHYERAETAILYSSEIEQLTGYPWGLGPNTNLGSSYWNWNSGSVLRGEFPYDGLTPGSFESGDAAKYRVIVDSNSSIMDEKLVGEIEKWVRAGGTFITIAQTGRHAPEKPDSWPIARLTGYRVGKIDRLKPDGGIDQSGTLRAAPGQNLYDASWNGVRANGLHMEKQAADAQDLLLWDGGDVAAGYRPLGKGFMVQLGVKFTGKSIADRIEPGGNNPETKQLRALLTTLLKWRDVAPEAGHLAQPNEQVMLRPGVSNNGLYDVWTLWNQSPDKNQTVSVEFESGRNPSFAINARDGRRFDLANAKLEQIALEPLETKVFLTPRADIAGAPLQWFDLQRNWWRATKGTDSKPFPQSPARYALDLTGDWKFQTIDPAADAAPMAAPTFNDVAWESRDLGIWNTKGNSGHGVFRKSFTVPAHWKGGRISLWMTSWYNTSFVDKARVWLDGTEIKGMNEGAVPGLEFESLTPGSSHVLVVEAQGAGVLAGLRGESWIAFEPAPAARLDLAGQWEPSKDALKYEAPIALPGAYNAQLLRRTATVDAKYRGQNAVVTVEGEGALVGVIVNGTLVRRHHHLIGQRWGVNVAPFIRWGEPNEFQIVNHGGANPGTVREVSLNFYDPQIYP